MVFREHFHVPGDVFLVHELILSLSIIYSSPEESRFISHFQFRANHLEQRFSDFVVYQISWGTLEFLIQDVWAGACRFLTRPLLAAAARLGTTLESQEHEFFF